MLIITSLWGTLYIFEHIFCPLGIPPYTSSFTEGSPGAQPPVPQLMPQITMSLMLFAELHSNISIKIF